MSIEKDGGPAFPVVSTEYNFDLREYEVVSTGGMSLRDYFAAKAMQGMLATENDKDGQWIASICAERAYKFADVMLRARLS